MGNFALTQGGRRFYNRRTPLSRRRGRTSKNPTAGHPDRGVRIVGPVSPMDRPDPNETNRPQAGVALRQRRVQTPEPEGLNNLTEPIRPRIQTRLDGGSVFFGEKKMKHFCVDTKLKHFCVDTKIKHFRVDLKVCEGCGGLWLRAHKQIQNHGVYCRSCASWLSEFPAPRGRSRAGRKPRLQLVPCTGGSR